MGIPSYYKKLCSTVKGINVRSTGTPIDYLWFDYNCLIYYVLKSMPAYTPGDAESWEAELIKRTCAYTRTVVKAAGNPRAVFLGVDGVVPFAKIKQQRLRRWKSIWTTEEEQRLGKLDVNAPVWDRNALTPGTAFMNKLSAALERLSQEHKWACSTVHEPGEGEHKVMSRLRELRELSEDKPATHVIYGLDADLILLTLYNARFLHPESTLYLLREDDKETQTNPLTNTIEYVYSYFNVGKLRTALMGKIRRTGEDELTALTDYIFAMTLLGNDFVPHGLSLSLKGDGYENLMRILRDPARPRLISPALTWCTDGLQYIYTYSAALEAGWIVNEIQHKRESVKHRAVYGADANEPWARAYSHWMKRPAQRMDEYALTDSVGEKTVSLHSNWRHLYYKVWFGTQNCKGPCDSYNEGLDWVLRYYTGQTVDLFWYYPWNLPPLFSDLAAHYTKWLGRPVRAEKKTVPLTEVEQCAMALPASSLHLCTDRRYHVLPQIIPHYFPSRCKFFYAGKHLLWECEPRLGLITPERLRSIVKRVI